MAHQKESEPPVKNEKGRVISPLPRPPYAWPDIASHYLPNQEIPLDYLQTQFALTATILNYLPLEEWQNDPEKKQNFEHAFNDSIRLLANLGISQNLAPILTAGMAILDTQMRLHPEENNTEKPEELAFAVAEHAATIHENSEMFTEITIYDDRVAKYLNDLAYNLSQYYQKVEALRVSA